MANMWHRYALLMMCGIVSLMTLTSVLNYTQFMSYIGYFSFSYVDNSVLYVSGTEITLALPASDAPVFFLSSPLVPNVSSPTGMLFIESTLRGPPTGQYLFDSPGHQDTCVYIQDDAPIHNTSNLFVKFDATFTHTSYIDLRYDACNTLMGIETASVYFPGTDWMHCQDYFDARNISEIWTGFYCQATFASVYLFCPNTTALDRLVGTCYPKKTGIEVDPDLCCNRARNGVVDFSLLLFGTYTLCHNRATGAIIASNTSHAECEAGLATKWQFVRDVLYVNGLMVRWNSDTKALYTALGVTHPNSGIRAITELQHINAAGTIDACTFVNTEYLRLHYAGVNHNFNASVDPTTNALLVDKMNTTETASLQAFHAECHDNDYISGHTTPLLCVSRDPYNKGRLVLMKQTISCVLHVETAEFRIDARTHRLEHANGVPVCADPSGSGLWVSAHHSGCDSVVDNIYMARVRGETNTSKWIFYQKRASGVRYLAIHIGPKQRTFEMLPVSTPQYTLLHQLKDTVNHVWFRMQLINTPPQNVPTVLTSTQYYLIAGSDIADARISTLYRQPKLVWPAAPQNVSAGAVCANDAAGRASQSIFEQRGCAWSTLNITQKGLCAKGYIFDGDITENDIGRCIWIPKPTPVCQKQSAWDVYPVVTICTYKSTPTPDTCIKCEVFVGFVTPSSQCRAHLPGEPHIGAWCSGMHRIPPSSIPASAADSLVQSCGSSFSAVQFGGSKYVSHYYVDKNTIAHDVSNSSLCF